MIFYETAFKNGFWDAFNWTRFFPPQFRISWSLGLIGDTPSSPSDQTEKEIEVFYDKLRLAIKNQKTEYQIIMGDFYVKLWAKQEEEKRQIGEYGFCRWNTREESMSQFMSEYNVYKKNSSFKRINSKWIWISPNKTTKERNWLYNYRS